MGAIELITATLAYIALNAYIYYMIEVKGIVLASLNYKPWICRTCLTFWLSVWFSVAAVMVGLYTFGAAMAVIGTLDAAAKKIDEKERYG